MSDQIRASDWCAAHREWSPCPDCETEATIARLTRERDEALREVTRLRGVVHTYMTSHDEQIAQERLALIGQAVRERDAARAEAEDAAAAYNAARRDLAAETATRTALRTQESRVMGILADAGVPVGDVVRGVEVLAKRHDALNAEVNATLRRLQEAHEERDALHQELADMDPNATAQARDERDAALHQLRRACGVLTRNKSPDDPHQSAQAIIEEYRDTANERDHFEELAIQRGRWSRLWHAEARRLWLEVQALSDPDAPYAEVDPREFARQLGGCPTCGLPVHPEHDACRLSREGAR